MVLYDTYLLILIAYSQGNLWVLISICLKLQKKDLAYIVTFVIMKFDLVLNVLVYLTLKE